MVKTLNNRLLYCKQLIKDYKYSKYSIKVLNCITLTIQYGEIIAIIGTSGSGKSTLLHLMGGLDKPTKGDILFEGKVLNKLSDKDCAIIRNKRLGFVYQFHHLLPDFSIIENVAMPLLIGGVNYKASKNKAKFMLKLVGLQNRLKHYPYELSGGESQRVAIARAIINDPVLVLADEPTGNLDDENSNNIFQLLKKLNAQYGTAFIIATHDLSLAKQCHKIFTISNGTLEIV